MFFPERKRKEFRLEVETALKLQHVYVRVHSSTKGQWETATFCGSSWRMGCPAVKVYLKVSPKRIPHTDTEKVQKPPGWCHFLISPPLCSSGRVKSPNPLIALRLCKWPDCARDRCQYNSSWHHLSAKYQDPKSLISSFIPSFSCLY